MKYLLFIFALLSMGSCGDSQTGVNIRLENVSEYDFKNIIVITDMNYNYDNLNSAETSEYQEHGFAYRYAYIELNIDSTTYFIQPIDFVGETKLVDGNYSYLIGASSDTDDIYGRLNIELRED